MLSCVALSRVVFVLVFCVSVVYVDVMVAVFDVLCISKCVLFRGSCVGFVVLIFLCDSVLVAFRCVGYVVRCFVFVRPVWFMLFVLVFCVMNAF